MKSFKRWSSRNRAMEPGGAPKLLSVAPDESIEIPRTEPGWNVNAEVYFRTILRPLAGSEIRVKLLVIDELDSGWDETNVIYEDNKIGQLPESYHKRMGPHLRLLRSQGKVLDCVARVSETLELKLLVPFPENLIPLATGGAISSEDVAQPSTGKRWVTVKESGKSQESLRGLSESVGSGVWTGEAICKDYVHQGGKYDGQRGVEVFVRSARIGAISPRYVDDLLPITRAMENGVVKFECRVERSKFEEDKLFATLFI